MTPRAAWRSQEAALAVADPELVIRVGAAALNLRQVDPREEAKEREAAALALGDRLAPAKAKALGVPGAAELVAGALALARSQASEAVRRRLAIDAELSTARVQLEVEGHAVIGSGWYGPPAGRAAIVRELLRSLPRRPGAAVLALAAIAAGVEAPPADADAWKRMKTGFTVELSRHSW